MSTLYIVRHGQASFYSSDYDQLSDIGYQQSRMLGCYWQENNIKIDAVYSGSLKRQIQTANACGETYDSKESPWPQSRILEGLNEYHADDVMEKLKPELAEKRADVRALSDAYANATEKQDLYRTFHRLLESVMTYYIEGDYESTGFESWRAFHERVTDAYRHIRANEGRGRTVAVFTSGGPIGVSVQSCLSAPEQAAAQLNWRVYNASIAQFTFSADRLSLDLFNGVPHLP